MQSIMMPAMAISFAVGPIAGQNFGAAQNQRVHETFSKGIMLSTILMLVITIFMQLRPELLVSFFTDEVEVIAVGAIFLRIISLNFIAQGIIFTCSGMFQGLGNTRPALLSSAIRLILFIPLAVYLKYQPDFAINQLWYVSVATVTFQAIVSFVLVKKELRQKLGHQASNAETA